MSPNLSLVESEAYPFRTILTRVNSKLTPDLMANERMKEPILPVNISKPELHSMTYEVPV